MKEKIIQVQTAINSLEEANRLADSLIESRLTACVQIVPITSIYRWKGQIEKTEEYLLLIKSTNKKKDEIEKTIKSLHTYELPEVISYTLDGFSEEYFEWILAETQTEKEEEDI
ncbi:MAG: divalent-cation tolerance protein CutA [Candidatus Heimdallarchaeaceae archaeon]